MGNPWICTLTHGTDSGHSQVGLDGLGGLFQPRDSAADEDFGILLLVWTGSSFRFPCPPPCGMCSQVWIAPGVFWVIDLRGH